MGIEQYPSEGKANVERRRARNDSVGPRLADGPQQTRADVRSHPQHSSCTVAHINSALAKRTRDGHLGGLRGPGSHVCDGTTNSCVWRAPCVSGCLDVSMSRCLDDHANPPARSAHCLPVFGSWLL